MMEFHEAANLFPMMDDDELLSLAQDIEANGLQHPVVIMPGTNEILDGRNRYRALHLLGRPCLDLKYYEGNDPVRYVVSLNLHRRHLTESQRAMIAARIAKLPKGRPETNPPIGAVSQENAAEQLNVGVRSVQRAKTVIDKGVPELVKAVEAGEVPVSAAAQVAELPKAEQSVILTQSGETKTVVKRYLEEERKKPEVKPTIAGNIEAMDARARATADKRDVVTGELPISEGERRKAAWDHLRLLYHEAMQGHHSEVWRVEQHWSGSERCCCIKGDEEFMADAPGLIDNMDLVALQMRRADAELICAVYNCLGDLLCLAVL